MKSILFAAAAAAPFAAALKQSTGGGGAKVVNKCNYEIPLRSVPAMGTGVENGRTSDKTLAAYGKGDNEFFTPWIQLLVSGGWAIKLNTIDSWTNIMQFEYTWATDNQLWFDNSFVDGIESEHPKWAFECPLCPEPPHNKAYQHSTDDAAGMQKPCGTDAVVTLVLCPGNTDSGSSSPAPAPAPAPSPSSTTAAPAPTTTSSPPPPPSTTLATSTSALPIKQANVADAPVEIEDVNDDPSGPVVVTAYETKVVTALVYETQVAQAKRKRHAHRHPHGHA